MRRGGITLLFLATILGTIAQAQSVTITFVANEGVLLSSRSGKVLIDALFRTYKDFVVPSDSLRGVMEAGQAPFDSVNLALATHWHGDHFEPRPVTAFLRANPSAAFLASRQVLDSLARYEPARSLPSRQLIPSTMAPGTRRRLTVNGVTLDVLGISHGTGRHQSVQHLGYLIDLDGVRILHLGDSWVEHDTFTPFRLATMRVDVALVPSWMLRSADTREVIVRDIRPRRVMAFHLGRDEEARVTREIHEVIPTAIILFRPLQQETVAR
ncbi:MAG TPA: MBL fold metallo-hydrolase [Gemmatimonadales bacterium]|nr:MBL fold metallo-hydrolase [Gemmatimonadales bacterium]